jgi:predicted RNA binding protein YcfA (HicA-like mRNA interferase family)
MASSNDVIARLRAEGWERVSVRGSHHQFRHPRKGSRVTVPHPVKDIKLGTLRSIYRQAGWPWK